MFAKHFRKLMARRAKKARSLKNALRSDAAGAAADLEMSTHSINDAVLVRVSSAKRAVLRLRRMSINSLVRKTEEDTQLGVVWLYTVLDMFLGLLFTLQLMQSTRSIGFFGCILHYWFCTALELLDILGKLHTGDDCDDGNKFRFGTARWRVIHDYCECTDRCLDSFASDMCCSFAISPCLYLVLVQSTTRT